MRICRIGIGFIVIFVCLSKSDSQVLAQDRVQDNSSLSEHVDELLQRWAKPDSPGYAVGIIRDGQFIHRRGYGMANLDEGIPITSETVFHVMSLSKSFATACVALAMDQGHFAPDDDVRKYVPELRDFGATITIRDLLTCHSGLRDYWHGMILLGRHVDDAYSDKDVFDLILRQKTLLFEPGERWGYSNTDWFLLSMIIERTSGKPLREFAAEQLFEPLGMNNTLFDDTPTKTLSHRAVSHGHDGRSVVRLSWNNESVGPVGLKTTLDDMLLWDTFLHDRQRPAGKYLAAFLHQGSLLGNKRCLSAFPAEEYKGLPRTWYTGAGMGSMAHYVRFPEQRFSIIAFGNHSTNVGWHDMEHVLPRIADLYLADEMALDNSELGADQPARNDGAPRVELSDERLQEIVRMAGTYRLPWGDYIELVLRDGELCVNQISAPWVAGHLEALIAVGENRFRSDRGYHEFELSFEDSAEPHVRPPIQVNYNNGDQERWEPVRFVTHRDEKLQDYTGEYYCDDLESVYRVSTTNGKLFVQYNFGRKRLYRPTLGESFIPVAERFVIPVEFSRDPNGNVTEFKTGFDRTGDLIFKRRAD